MTPERWQEIERLYQQALDLDPAVRSAFLDNACAADADLRREVDSLLAAHKPDNRFLESNALEITARSLAYEVPKRTPGQRLGAFELLAPLGAGGMGEVWRALDSDLNRQVAIKFLRPQYSRDPDRLRRFEQEARAAGMLNHPNILAVYAIGKENGSPYLVTELLEGSTLRERLARGALAERKAVEFAEQIAQGLAAAHEKGVVHRDLKPENIFITTDGRLKILDFGLAKLSLSVRGFENESETASGIAMGTPGYMSPEQVRGRSVDHRADIFALGSILYEMLSGQRTFLRGTSVETMNAILKEDPPPLPGASPLVEEILRHCLEKEPNERFQSVRDLGFQLQLARQPSTRTQTPTSTRSWRRHVGWAIAGVAFATTGAGIIWWLIHPTTPRLVPVFTRVTSDSGLTTDAAFSPDGKLIAYASDRSGAGNLDIWRQQLATGEAIRLTSHPSDESEPSFSPDGSRIAFRSEQDGGGIYVVSAFGGEPRLIAREGRRPRFSPDGAHIAYWIGSFYVGKVFIVPAAGGTPIAVQPDFASARYPVWSPDGKKLLVLAARTAEDIPVNGNDWWVVSLDGGPAIKTDAFDTFRLQGIREADSALASSVVLPSDWVGDNVFFSATTDSSTNLWRIPVSVKTGNAAGSAQQLTVGTAIEAKPSAISQGRIAFVSLTHNLNIWDLQIEANTGKIRGEVHQLTSGAFDSHTSLSADGTKLVYVSTRSGNPDVWVKDLVSGKETALTATPSIVELQSELTADGARVLYSVIEGAKGSLYQIATAGGLAEKICDDCGLPWDWSPDGEKILYMIPEGRKGPGLALGLFDLIRRQKTDYLYHPSLSLARARFSPDGRWIALIAGKGPSANRVVVIPFQDQQAPAEDQWISITEETTNHEKPRWSPDGNLLYYTSDADGFRCIRAQRLDPITKRPLGSSIDVYHSHSARRSLMNAGIELLEISLSQERLVFNLAETTGNIWIAEWKP